MTEFKLHAPYTPLGDQPQAIEKLVAGVEQGIKHQTLLGATGTGKSTSYDCPVFIVKQVGDQVTSHVEPIGPLVDSLIAQHDANLRYHNDTAILDSAATGNQYFAQSFNPATGAVDLYPIQSFTRHSAPAAMYHLKTTCGRSVTLTGDHNLWVLRDGRLQLIETTAARPTDRIPLPLTLLGAGELHELELMPRLAGKNMFIDASEMIRAYVAEQGSKAFVQAIDAQGISGNHKISHIRHAQRGAGIAIDMLPDVLQRTDNFGGHWNVRQATISSSASTHQMPSSLALTPPLLRLIGYYIAEGNGQKDCIIIANDQPTIRESIEVAVNQLGLTFTVQPSSDYKIWSVALAHVLGTECGKVSRAKSLPSFWPQLSNADLGLLLQAYFDGDGTVDRANAISATTASQKLASDLCYALLRFGIWGRIGKRWKRATNSDHAGDWYYQVTISGQSDLRRFYEQVGFSLDYKQQALAAHLGQTENSNVDLVPLDGAQLRWLRQQLGLFAREVGALANLSRSAIQTIELEGRAPQRSSLLRILEALRDVASTQPVADQWWQVWHSIHGLCNLRWTAIESVAAIEYDHPHVYDFCVPGAETFLAGSGGLFVHNTFVAAEIVQRLQRPTLVMAHNKTLAAQLYSEFKEFFPENAVGYFVSYYDAYTPEAYVPSKDLYIEKEAQINEEIDRLRHEATQALFTRRDVLIVASVSAIYGLGSPTDYGQVALGLRVGEVRNRDKVLRTLIDLQFERNDIDFHRGTFRVRGDTLEIFPANAETAYRVEMWGDEIERIVEVDPLTGEILATKKTIDIFPAKHFVTTSDKMQAAISDIEQELVVQLAHLEGEGKILEAARLKQRTMYDLEIMQELGYCSGIENYSRHMDRRGPGQTPWTLLDYFPDDFLLFVDESHISMPQIRGMFNGDKSRKQTLVDFGFRLPSALDNRPLMFDEFERHVHQAIYVSATPGPYEYQHSEQVVQQIIRPTGLIDPVVHVRPTRGQIDDLLDEIKRRVDTGSRAIVTTLTKRMAEDLTDYLKEMGVRTEYLHSDVDTLERVDILRDLRLGVFDVVVGINLLREGLDLPEVSLVAILDADKAGFLRSESALIQTIGRAARHIDGTVIMYGDRITPAMQYAIDETKRRRAIQEAYNLQHGIEPKGIVKGIRDINERLRKVADEKAAYTAAGQDTSGLGKDALFKLIVDAEKQMKQAAKNLEFEKAALLRDQVTELRQTLALMDDVSVIESLNQRPRRTSEAKPAYGDKKKVKGRPRGKM